MFKHLKDVVLKTIVFSISGLALMGASTITPITVNGNDVRVIDGDTIVVKQTLNRPEIRVRLACIDAPELKQPLGVESKEFLKTIIKDKTLTIYPIRVDLYGRSIALITRGMGEVTVQHLMVSNGMAYTYKAYRRDCQQYNTLSLIEKQAIEDKAGVWGQSEIVFPWDFRKQ